MNEIGIYVHIPFCIRKCNYCDFLSFPGTEEKYSAYIDMLCKQIDAVDESRSVASIYFGGGTPSIISPALINNILCKLNERFSVRDHAEITLEVNPKTATGQNLKDYFSFGINRLSIGLQSANDSELVLLGRAHNVADFVATYEGARAAGFQNINVDLMTALPGQTKTMLADTISFVTDLHPEHISAYSLILEEGTPFYNRYADHPEALPSESQERELYYMTEEMLAEKGYIHYEISNWARPGFESRHNSSYWTGQDYYGFGLGASSLLNHKRIRNCTDFNEYLLDPTAKEESISLSVKDRMEEFMFLGLRMMRGVSYEDFRAKFGISMSDVYGSEINRLAKQKLLDADHSGVRLTKQGVDYGNYVFSAFLL